MNESAGWHGPPTLRQLDAWEAWQKDEWNKPSRTDHYLMALRRDVHGLFGDPGALDKYKIEFIWQERQLTAEEAEETAEREALMQAQVFGAAWGASEEDMEFLHPESEQE